MSMNDQDIQTMQEIGGFMLRKLRGDISDAENASLEAWLGGLLPADKKFFEDATDWNQIEEALRFMYGIDEEAALRDVQNRIQQVKPGEARVVLFNTVSRKLLYSYVAVAAAVVLLAGAGIFFYFNDKKNLSDIPISVRYHNDVNPGTDKAILLLADGSKIVLDSTNNTFQLQQGNAKVVNSKDGGLEYEINDQPPVPAEVSWNTVATPRGGQYQVKLPDGSKVWLNAQSSLRFPTAFTGKERIVELMGEAYFEVVRNTAIPFKVSIVSNDKGVAVTHAPMQVEVLGTEFNIEAYPDEAGSKATLIHGAVKVTSGNEQTTLVPGQQARVGIDGAGDMEVLSGVNTDDVIAWKNGLFQFQDEPIESIMRKISRWYDVDIIYSEKVNKLFIGKIPRTVQISTVLKILESTGWVHFTIDGRKITVAP